jgi:hypothetical protein
VGVAQAKESRLKNKYYLAAKKNKNNENHDFSKTQDGRFSGTQRKK